MVEIMFAITFTLGNHVLLFKPNDCIELQTPCVKCNHKAESQTI